MDFSHTNHPIENEYPKLVRDRIPEIIKEKTGSESEYRVLDDDSEFLSALFAKMIEESMELSHSLEDSNLEEELADIFEVITSILAVHHKTIEDIVDIQKEKRAKRGGFDKRILMLKKAPPKLRT